MTNSPVLIGAFCPGAKSLGGAGGRGWCWKGFGYAWHAKSLIIHEVLAFGRVSGSPGMQKSSLFTGVLIWNGFRRAWHAKTVVIYEVFAFGKATSLLIYEVFAFWKGFGHAWHAKSLIIYEVFAFGRASGMPGMQEPSLFTRVLIWKGFGHAWHAKPLVIYEVFCTLKNPHSQRVFWQMEPMRAAICENTRQG